MAITAPRRRARNAEGRMALREHLIELRRRVIISAVAAVLGAVVGWFLADPAQQNLILDPLQRAADAQGIKVRPSYLNIIDPFNIKVKLAVYIGLVITSPVWLYQIWAFITPGLTRRERRTSLWFMVFAVPLFAAGVALAVFVLPKAIVFSAEFGLDGASNQPNFSGVITFAVRLIGALGMAFLLPLFLVALNMMNIVTGRALGKQWRVAVFVAFLFAAIVSPSPDPTQMIILALPLVVLYSISVAVCLLNDRRRRRRREADPVFGLGEDEASPIAAPEASLDH